MASQGDRITRKVGEAILVEFDISVAGEVATGLSPVVTVYDEADGSFATPTVTEPVAGLYRASFTPDAAGTWHVFVAESTIPFEVWRAYHVAASVAGDTLAAIETDTQDIQGRLPATLSSGRMRSQVEDMDSTVFDDIQTEAEQALETYRLDELLSVALSANPVNASLAGIIMFRDGSSSSDRTFCSLEAIGSMLSALPSQTDFAALVTIAGSSTTEVRTSANEANGFYNGMVFVVEDASNHRAARRIVSYAQTNGAFTVAPALPFTPGTGATCYVLALPLENLDAAVSTRSSHSAADVDTTLTASHGAGSWQTATGFPSAAAVADAVLDELLAGHVTAGSLAVAIADILADTASIQPTVASNLDAAVSSRSSHSAADVDTQLSGAHGAGSWATATGFSTHSPADVADAVLDELLAGHVTAGSLAVAVADILADTAAMQPVVAANLDAAVSTRSSHSAADVNTTLTASHGAGSWQTATGFPVASAIADAVLDELLAGHATAGSLGAAISDILADTAAIQPDAALTRKLLQNRFQINTATGIGTLYDDDGTTPLLTVQLYLDAAGGSTYDATAAIHRRDAFS